MDWTRKEHWISKIDDFIYMGSWESRQFVEEYGIKTVVAIAAHTASEAKLPETVKEFRYTTGDSAFLNIIPVVLDAFEVIKESIERQEAVLVHCSAGISRSASVVIGYLIKSRKMTADEALSFVKERRPWVQPNEGFWKQLQTLEF